MPEPHLQIYRKKRHIFFDNFLGGIAWSLGTVVGFSAIAIIVGFLISKVDLIPIFGSWFADILRSASLNLNNPPGH